MENMNKVLDSITRQDLMVLGVLVSMYRENNCQPVLQGNVYKFMIEHFNWQKTVFYNRIRHLEQKKLIEVTQAEHKRRFIIPSVSVNDFENYICNWCSVSFFPDKPSKYLDCLFRQKLCKMKEVNSIIEKHKVRRLKRVTCKKVN